MPKLQLLEENRVIQEWELASSAVVIGRQAGSDVQLEDVSVSRTHARLHRQDSSGAFVVEDLGSKNGTFVNGTKILSAQRLFDGDTLYLGSSTLRFVDSEPLEDLLRDVGKDHEAED